MAKYLTIFDFIFGSGILKIYYYRYIQLGIVSFGTVCGHQERPGVYTRISSMVEWIQIMTDYSAQVWDFSCHAATTATSEPIDDYAKMSDILLFKENDELAEMEDEEEVGWIKVGKLQSPRKGHAVSIIRRSEMAAVCVRWNQGIINSPNYPKHYPNNVNKVTQFTNTNLNFTYLLFLLFQIIYLFQGMVSQGCRRDRAQDPTNIYKFQHRIPPPLCL